MPREGLGGLEAVPLQRYGQRKGWQDEEEESDTCCDGGEQGCRRERPQAEGRGGLLIARRKETEEPRSHCSQLQFAFRAATVG